MAAEAAALPLGLWVALGGVLGAMVGSYVATAVVRAGRHESALSGRSRCDSCGVKLRPWELVPLASFAFARGRCRRCATAIERVHPLIEGAAALIGGAALAVVPGPEGFAGAVLGWLLLALGWLDARFFWLPNALVAPLALAGLGAGALGIAPPLSARLEGGIGGFALLGAVGLLYRATRGRHGLGGGDPKLFGAIGLWLGWRALPFVLLGASLAGLLWVALRAARGEPIGGTTQVPLGTLLCLAAWTTWLLAASGMAIP